MKTSACLVLLACAVLPAATTPCSAAPDARTGPTLALRYDGVEAPNPIADFMYFVPLISPVMVNSSTEPDNTQQATITGFSKTRNEETFRVVCGFAVTGTGSHEYAVVFDDMVRKHRKRLDRERPLVHVLDAIRIDDQCQGEVVATGVVTAQGERVDHVTVQFTDGTSKSPVSIALCDIAKDGDQVVKDKQLHARVAALSFCRTEGPPMMEARLVSLTKKGKAEGLWAHVKANIANLFIPPIRITSQGNQTMLDLGAALNTNAQHFTFPHAQNLK